MRKIFRFKETQNFVSLLLILLWQTNCIADSSILRPRAFGEGRPQAAGERQLSFSDQKILNAIKSLQERNEPVTQTAIAAEAQLTPATITNRKEANPAVAKAIQEAIALSTSQKPAPIEVITFTQTLIQARACLEQAKRLHKNGWHQSAINKCRRAIALAEKELGNEFPVVVGLAAETIQEAQGQIDTCSKGIAQTKEKMAMLPLDYLQEEIGRVRKNIVRGKKLTASAIRQIEKTLNECCRALTDDLLESTGLDVATIELIANELLRRVEVFIDGLKVRAGSVSQGAISEIESSI